MTALSTSPSGSVPRLVRLLVTIFVPWFALRKARKQLHLAALIMRNEARPAFRKENETLLRWADECEHDGWTIWKPYDTLEYRQWMNGGPKPSLPNAEVSQP